MTIIQPNKYKDIRKLVLVLGTVLIGTLLMAVFVYLQTVSLKHDLAETKEYLEEQKVANSELKDNFYGFLDTDNLEALAAERGLVQDKNPKWAFASGL